MYSIVEWVDSSEVSAVPSNWLVDDGDTLWSYWPATSGDGDPPIKQRWQPKNDWHKYRVRAIGSADSYHHALKRVKITESRSDLSAESCDDRETHHQRCLINMSTDDTVAFSVKSGKQRSRRDDAGSAVSMPFVPIPSGLQQSYLAPIAAPGEVPLNSDESQFRVPPPAMQRLNLKSSIPPTATDWLSPPPVTYSSNCNATLTTLMNGESTITPTRTDVPTSPLIIASSNSALGTPSTPLINRPACASRTNTETSRCTADSQVYSSTPGLGSVLNQLVKQTAEITEQVKLNTQLLQEVVKRQRCLNKDKVGPLPSNCQLPLHSFDELVASEQQLKSKDFYSRLVAFLASIGGATIKDFVKRSMTYLLDPDFAMQFVWAGRLTEKYAFRQLELKNVVIATQRNVLTATATMCDVEQELKWWLRGAPDRNGGRNERAKKTKVKQSKRKGQSERKEPAPRFEFRQCSTRRNTVSGSSRQRRSRDRSTVRESSVRRIDSHDRSRSSCSESSESRGSHGDHGLQHGSRHSSHSTQRRSRDSHTPARRRPVRHGSRNISRSRSARRDRSCSARSTDSNTTVDYRSTTHVRSTSDIGDTSRVSRECSTSYSTHESVAAPTDCL